MNTFSVPINEITGRCKQILMKHYGDRLQQVIVFGSIARNEANTESDIDLLVVLNPSFDYFRELRTIVELLYPIQLESELLISARPAAIDEFEQGSLQLYRNIQREGIRL
ncbi:MAG: nucleotidyltransferase [Leptolyngbya sp. ERB_1_1]